MSFEDITNRLAREERLLAELEWDRGFGYDITEQLAACQARIQELEQRLINHPEFREIPF